jgi:hypothetical protein
MQEVSSSILLISTIKDKRAGFSGPSFFWNLSYKDRMIRTFNVIFFILSSALFTYFIYIFTNALSDPWYNFAWLFMAPVAVFVFFFGVILTCYQMASKIKYYIALFTMPTLIVMVPVGLWVKIFKEII